MMLPSVNPANLKDPAFLRLPALDPPPGVVSDFIHPENKGQVLVAVNGVLSALMLIFIVVRAYTKVVLTKKLSWDDLTILIASISAFALYVLFAIGMFRPSP